MSKENILLIGGGGHAHACLHLARVNGIKPVGFVDDEEIQSVSGLGRSGSLGSYLESPSDHAVILGMGDHDHGKTRLWVFELLNREGVKILGLLSIDSNFEDQGYALRSNQVFFRTFFGPDCLIGSNNIFNNGSIVEHQCKIGSHCHLGFGAVLSGGCLIGDQVLIGANATILPGIEINTGNIIGAGSVVVRSIYDSGGIYAGNPARKIGEFGYQL